MRCPSRSSSYLTACFATLLLAVTAAAQVSVTDAAATDAVNVPRLVRFSGTVPDVSSTVGVTFALYAEQTGGAPLWIETQNVAADEKGRYTILLGANHAHGLPLDLFISGQARWLGILPEGAAAEQPRVLLVSVPYALKAATTDRFRGLPLSAFQITPQYAAEAAAIDPNAHFSNAAGTNGTAGYIPKYLDSVNMANSTLQDDGANVTFNAGHVYAGLGRRIQGNFSDANHANRLLYINSQTNQKTVVGFMPNGTATAAAANLYGGSNAAQTSVGQFRIDVNNTNLAVGDVVAMRSFATCPSGTSCPPTPPVLPISFQFAQPNTNEAEAMRIVPRTGGTGLMGGYVGMGIKNPLYPLDLAAQNGNVHAAFGATNNGLFLISNLPQVGFNLTWPQGAFHYQYATSNYAGYIAMGQDGDGAFSFATAPSGVAGADVTPTARMFIKNDGKVGIGTVTPGSLLEVAGDITALGATFTDPIIGGTAVTGVCNLGAACWGVYGTTTDGIGVRGYSSTGYGVYGNTTSGTGGRFNSSTGKALSGVVGGTEVFAVDAEGVHAGPAMTGTPLAHALINGNPGSELADTHTPNVTAASWTSTGVCEVTISGETLDYLNYTVVVSVYTSSGGFASSTVESGHLKVYTFDKNGTAANRSFNFILMKL